MTEYYSPMDDSRKINFGRLTNATLRIHENDMRLNRAVRGLVLTFSVNRCVVSSLEKLVRFDERHSHVR